MFFDNAHSWNDWYHLVGISLYGDTINLVFFTFYLALILYIIPGVILREIIQFRFDQMIWLSAI